MDRAWWVKYFAGRRKRFAGEKITCNQNVQGVKSVRFSHPKNSGAGAVALAEYFGARRIIMLGYDCQYAEDGKRHWHGDHPKGLGNAVSMPHWYEQFRELSTQLTHCEIINASRATRLEFWPRQSLEAALGDLRS